MCVLNERRAFAFNYIGLILTALAPASIQQLFNSNVACVRIVLFLVYTEGPGEGVFRANPWYLAKIQFNFSWKASTRSLPLTFESEFAPLSYALYMHTFECVRLDELVVMGSRTVTIATPFD
nr:unnamed protein product [Callosobruchus chinensis]